MRENVFGKVVQEAACSEEAGHKVSQGGLPMEIKHQHPDYATREERSEQLQETHRACIGMIRSLRTKAGDGEKRTA